MATIRTQKNDNPFVMIDKRPLEDTRLSWEAKGLHAYLMSKPDNWTVNVKHLIKQSRNGRDATYRIVNELILAGYIERNQLQKDDGTFGEIEYILHELPTHFEPFEMPKTKKKKTEPHPENQEAVNKPHTEFPDTDKPETDKPKTDDPDTGRPDTENPDISNNESSNNDFSHNEITKKNDDDSALKRELINQLVFKEFESQINHEQFAKIIERIPSNKKTTDYKAYLTKCVKSEIEELSKNINEQPLLQQAATNEPKVRNKAVSKRNDKKGIPVITPESNLSAPMVDDDTFAEMMKFAAEMQHLSGGRK